MGIRKRVVLEIVCDLCGKDIDAEAGRTGLLEAKTTGARGRGERHLVAFHEACYAKLVGSATKPAVTRRRRAKTPTPSPDGAATTTGAKKATGRKKATAKRAGRGRRRTAAASPAAS